MVERMNRTVEGTILKVMEEKEDWLKLLPSVCFACNVSKNSSTGYTPFFMLFQRVRTYSLINILVSAFHFPFVVLFTSLVLRSYC